MNTADDRRNNDQQGIHTQKFNQYRLEAKKTILKYEVNLALQILKPEYLKSILKISFPNATIPNTKKYYQKFIYEEIKELYENKTSFINKLFEKYYQKNFSENQSIELYAKICKAHKAGAHLRNRLDIYVLKLIEEENNTNNPITKQHKSEHSKKIYLNAIKKVTPTKKLFLQKHLKLMSYNTLMIEEFENISTENEKIEQEIFEITYSDYILENIHNVTKQIYDKEDIYIFSIDDLFPA